MEVIFGLHPCKLDTGICFKPNEYGYLYIWNSVELKYFDHSGQIYRPGQLGGILLPA
jgi:hypothetical protein